MPFVRIWTACRMASFAIVTRVPDTRPGRVRPIVGLLALAVPGVALLLPGLAVLAQTPAAPQASAQPTQAIARTMLLSATPFAAPGWELSLRRVTYQPGAGNAGEVHVGQQIVLLVEGQLSVRAMTSQLTVRRAQVDGTPGPPEAVTPETGEVVVRAGDVVLEPEACVHAVRNSHAGTTTILVAAFLPAGQPTTLMLQSDRPTARPR